jgi:hypothetical protein
MTLCFNFINKLILEYFYNFSFIIIPPNIFNELLLNIFLIWIYLRLVFKFLKNIIRNNRFQILYSNRQNLTWSNTNSSVINKIFNKSCKVFPISNLVDFYVYLNKLIFIHLLLTYLRKII